MFRLLPISRDIWIFSKPPHTVNVKTNHYEAFWGNLPLVRPPCNSPGYATWKENIRFNQGHWLELEQICWFGVECYYISLRKRKRKQWILIESHFVYIRDWFNVEQISHLFGRYFGNSAGRPLSLDYLCIEDPDLRFDDRDTLVPVQILHERLQSWFSGANLSNGTSSGIRTLLVKEFRSPSCSIYKCSEGNYGWYATMVTKQFSGNPGDVIDLNILKDSDALFMPPLKLAEAVRPPLGEFLSHEAMFMAQAILKVPERLTRMGIPFRTFGKTLVIYGTQFEISVKFCKPPDKIELLTVTITGIEHDYQTGRTIEYRSDECFTLRLEFDVKPEIIPVREIIYPGAENISNPPFMALNYRDWRGNLFIPIIDRGPGVDMNITDNIPIWTWSPGSIQVGPPLPSPNQYENEPGGFPLFKTSSGRGYQRSEGVTYQNVDFDYTWTTTIGECAIPTEYPTRVGTICVDNLGNPHPYDDDQVAFYLCRTSNTATCLARFSANAITALINANKAKQDEWDAYFIEFGFDQGPNPPRITPLQISIALAQAAVQALASCPPRIDDGSFPSLLPLN